MFRCVAAVVIAVFVLCSDVGAQWRSRSWSSCNTSCYTNGNCGRLSWHSYGSSHGWSAGCISCHQSRGLRWGGYQDSSSDGGGADRYQSSEQWRLHLQRWAEGAQRSAQEQQEFESTYDKLFAPLFGGTSAPLQGGGLQPGYGGYQFGAQQQLGYNYAPQGSTAYQWSSLTAQPGRTLDRALIYNLASQLAKDSTGLAGKANDGALGLIAADVEGEKELIAENLKHQSLVTALKIVSDQMATPAPGSGVAQVQTFRITQSQNGTPVLERLAAPGSSAQAVIAAKCAACHNPQKAEGNLDLTLWPNVNDAVRQSVYSRIVAPDPNKRMPKAADGSAGVPLPWQDIQAFLCDLPAASRTPLGPQPK